ncbi:MAG: tetratricopeptide repeat protein [Phycisphaerae bacterium]|nr:tetratricopeptide repeat protein [Phycisphaerae bacterium]
MRLCANGRSYACCVIAGMALPLGATGFAFGQVDESAKHALYTTPQANAESPTAQPKAVYRKAAENRHEQPASYYGDEYRYRSPHMANPYFYDPYATQAPYRLRQWGPDGRTFGVPGRPFRGYWIDDDYRQWRHWSQSRKSNERGQRLLNTHGKMMSRGLAAFAQGDYDQARSAFALAASVNVFDPACRIHMAHACFALGRYGQAVRWLREAFGLEPRILDLPYDVRTDYGDPDDFVGHVARLERAVQGFSNEADPLIVLGYVRYYTGDRTKAYEALSLAGQRVAKNEPKRELIEMLLEASEPSRYAGKKGD